MSEHVEHTQEPEQGDRVEYVDHDDVPVADADFGPASAQVRTGHRDVDEALSSLEDLSARPLEDHVRVFESVHEALRAALADAGERPAEGAGG